MANQVNIKNLGAFQKSLATALAGINKDLVPLVMKKVAFDALRGFTMGTRVDTGRARGGWQVSKNSPISGDQGKKDKTGTSVLNEGLSKLNGIDADDTIFIQNNVKYIGILERNDHMVDNTLRRLTANIKSGNI